MRHCSRVPLPPSSPPEQLPHSLWIAGRTPLSIREVSSRLNISVQQVLDFIDEGEFVALDVSSKNAKRKTYRIPVESLRDFVITRTFGELRRDLLRQMPRPLLEELREMIDRALKN